MSCSKKAGVDPCAGAAELATAEPADVEFVAFASVTAVRCCADTPGRSGTLEPRAHAPQTHTNQKQSDQGHGAPRRRDAYGRREAYGRRDADGTAGDLTLMVIYSRIRWSKCALTAASRAMGLVPRCAIAMPPRRVCRLFASPFFATLS